MEKDFEFVDSHVECDLFNGICVWISDAESQLNKRFPHVLHKINTSCTKLIPHFQQTENIL